VYWVTLVPARFAIVGYLVPRGTGATRVRVRTSGSVQSVKCRCCCFDSRQLAPTRLAYPAKTAGAYHRWPATLFQRGDLRGFLDEVRRNAVAKIEQVDEDELRGRSTDDLVAELIPLALVGTLEVDSEPADGSVNETTFEMVQTCSAAGGPVRAWQARATYPYQG
jgi:hypothetical protein